MMPRSHSSTRSGFTLVEAAVSLGIFATLGYALVVGMSVAHDSEATVMRVRQENQELRWSTLGLVDEMRTTSDSRITVTTLADGNHQLVFMVPVVVVGVDTWGVYDRSLSTVVAGQSKADWTLRYTVRDAVAAGGTTKELVRQVVDDTQVVRRERVVATDLCSGQAGAPGFRVVKNGEIWELTLSTNGALGSASASTVVFHVQTRN